MVLRPRCLSQLGSALPARLSPPVIWLWEMNCVSRASGWKAADGCEPKRMCLSSYCMSSISPGQHQVRRQRPKEAPIQSEWGPQTCSMSQEQSVGEQIFELRSVWFQAYRVKLSVWMQVSQYHKPFYCGILASLFINNLVHLRFICF